MTIKAQISASTRIPWAVHPFELASRGASCMKCGRPQDDPVHCYEVFEGAALTAAMRDAEAQLGNALTALEIVAQYANRGDEGLLRRLASNVEHTRNAVTELRDRYELGR